ncbi:alpha/beta hydrolase [Saccharomonospora sp. NPDC046836]|uniref:alpha/beta hydrolase n=1 Tax=Saccharomonospora sp. NPDC046836 TaxID=3156921 RepID=UPI00340DDDCC
MTGLAACTSEPASEPTGPAGPVPAGLERYYGQSLDWGPCQPYAKSERARSTFQGEGLECARLTVPLDYTKPQGTTITIGVLRQRATDAGDRIGSLVLNPGGPGASGMEAAAVFAPGVANRPLGERFDLVGFDPRGIGASEPTVQCLTGPERDTERAEDIEVDGTPSGVRAQEAEQRDFAQKCAQRTEYGNNMLAHVGTRDVVKDIDVLRSVLGDQKLTYLGYSYGTRIGYTYAETFPGNVRALLLDGALDPEQDLVDSTVAQGAGFGKAFGEFASWCAQQQDCALGTNPADATRAYQDLTRPLIDDPVQVGDGRRLSYQDATTGTIQALYTSQLWSQLNSGLNELKQQRGTALMALADMYNERGTDGRYATTQDAFVAVRCVDDPRVTDRNEIIEAQRRYAQVAPFLDPGTPPSSARDACNFWPVPNTSEPGQPDVQGVPPTLVISTTNDPATPYQAGVNLAKALHGRLLTFEGTQHTVFLQGNECVDTAGTDYLVDGTLPADGTRC